MAGGALTVSKPTAIAVQTFTVPPRHVYDAILEPAMIARYMFGPLLPKEEVIHIRNKPGVGGAFSYKVRRGDTDIDHIGTYLELDPPSCIVFTRSIAGHGDDDPSIVSIDVTPTADACSLASPTRWTRRGSTSSTAPAPAGRRCSASSRHCSRPAAPRGGE